MMDTLFDLDLLRRGGVPRTRICDCDGLRLDELAAPPAGGRLAVKDSLFDCDLIEVCSQCSEFSDADLRGTAPGLRRLRRRGVDLVLKLEVDVPLAAADSDQVPQSPSIFKFGCATGTST